MTVQELYEHYRLMPALQLHQLRVAAVAKMICDTAINPLDTESVVLAGLFHDMANIIKSDLDTFPDFVEPEGKAHWQLIKDQFVEKYGTNEHAAMLEIVREIGLPSRVVGLMSHIGFSNLERLRDKDDLEQKIVEYADLRVGPHGVIPMPARIEEARLRYAGRHPDVPHEPSEFERLRNAALDIEFQIFSAVALAPDDITEAGVQPLISSLRELQIA